MCDNESWNWEKMLNNLSDFFLFIEDASCTEKQVAWIAQVWFWFILPWCSILISFDPTIFSHYFTGLSKCCTFRATFRQDILNIFHHAFLHQWWKANIILCDEHAYNCGGWVHYLFSQKQLYLPIPGLSVALHKRCLALRQLFWSFFSLLCLKSCGEHLVMLNYVLSTFQFWNSSVTNMFCNNKVVTVLHQLFGFTHHEMVLVWHLGNEAHFYRPSVGTEPADSNLPWVAGLLSSCW